MKSAHNLAHPKLQGLPVKSSRRAEMHNLALRKLGCRYVNSRYAEVEDLKNRDQVLVTTIEGHRFYDDAVSPLPHRKCVTYQGGPSWRFWKVMLIPHFQEEV